MYGSQAWVDIQIFLPFPIFKLPPNSQCQVLNLRVGRSRDLVLQRAYGEGGIIKYWSWKIHVWFWLAPSHNYKTQSPRVPRLKANKQKTKPHITSTDRQTEAARRIVFLFISLLHSRNNQMYSGAFFIAFYWFAFETHSSIQILVKYKTCSQ